MKAKMLFTLIASIALAGCYETEKPVIEKGDKVSIAGEFECKNRITGKVQPYVIKEQSEGMWPFSSYRYVDQDGDSSLYKKLSNGFYLVQQKGKRGAYDLFYLDVIDKKNFILLAADLSSKGPYIEALIKKYNVGAAKAKNGVRLSADNSTLLAFFAAHDKSLLAAVISCVGK